MPKDDALLSREDIARKWVYSIKTLTGKMSNHNITAACRINGNRTGRYLQSEITQKWGAPLYD